MLITFVGFKRLMQEKRELTIQEKADLANYFEERKDTLEIHERIVRDLKLELFEINKRLDKMP